MFLLFLRWFVIAVSTVATILFVLLPSVALWIILTIFIGVFWIVLTVVTKRIIKVSLIHYILTPVLLWVSVLSVLVFTPRGILQYLLIGIAAILSAIWSMTLRYPLARDDEWLIFRGNLLNYINSFIIFFTASSLYAAMIFLSFPSTIALALIAALSLLLHFHIMRASHLVWHQIKYHSFTIALFLTELFAALLVWPTSFWVKGLLVTIGFYIATGLSRCALTSIMTKQLIKRYLLWGGLIVFLILVTAPWQ